MNFFKYFLIIIVLYLFVTRLLIFVVSTSFRAFVISPILGFTVLFLLLYAIYLFISYIKNKSNKSNIIEPSNFKNNQSSSLNNNSNNNPTRNRKKSITLDDLESYYLNSSSNNNRQTAALTKTSAKYQNQTVDTILENINSYESLDSTNSNLSNSTLNINNDLNNITENKVEEITTEHVKSYVEKSIYFEMPTRKSQISDSSSTPKNSDPLLDAIKYRKRRKFDSTFVVFDFETTGFSYKTEDIIEIGAAKFKNGNIIGTFNTYICPSKPISKSASRVNGITNEMVATAPSIEEILPDFCDFIDKGTLVAHNASFDMKFLLKSIYYYNKQSNYRKLTSKNLVFDTLSASRKAFPELPNHKLPTLLEYLNIDEGKAHSALPDAIATGKLYLKCKEQLE